MGVAGAGLRMAGDWALISRETGILGDFVFSSDALGLGLVAEGSALTTQDTTERNGSIAQTCTGRAAKKAKG